MTDKWVLLGFTCRQVGLSWQTGTAKRRNEEVNDRQEEVNGRQEEVNGKQAGVRARQVGFIAKHVGGALCRC